MLRLESSTLAGASGGERGESTWPLRGSARSGLLAQRLVLPNTADNRT